MVLHGWRGEDMIKSEILVPLLNANEPEARLVEIHVKDGQAVKKGLRLFTLETTKATSDIESSEAGFIRVLANEGAMLSVGDRLAVITDTANEEIELSGKHVQHSSPVRELRITKPARALADLLGVDLKTLPLDHLVTEELVRRAAGEMQKLDINLPPSKKPYLLIFGAGGHAKSIMDMVKQLDKYVIAGILDDDKQHDWERSPWHSGAGNSSFIPGTDRTWCQVCCQWSGRNP